MKHTNILQLPTGVFGVGVIFVFVVCCFCVFVFSEAVLHGLLANAKTFTLQDAVTRVAIVSDPDILGHALVKFLWLRFLFFFSFVFLAASVSVLVFLLFAFVSFCPLTDLPPHVFSTTAPTMKLWPVSY